MSELKLLKVALVSLGAALPSSAATAATMQLIATGTVSGGYDHTGVFGAPGGSLDGQTATVRIVFDTEQGFRETETAGGYDQVSGGTSSGNAGPALSASLTVGGYTQSLEVSDWSYFYRCNTFWCGADTLGAQIESLQQAGNDWAYHSLSAYLFGDSVDPSSSLDTPFSSDTLPEATGNVAYSVIGFDTNTLTYSFDTYVSFSIDSLSMAQIDIAPVPLPAAGLPLLAALGGLGLAARKRRKAA